MHDNNAPSTTMVVPGTHKDFSSFSFKVEVTSNGSEIRNFGRTSNNSKAGPSQKAEELDVLSERQFKSAFS